MTTLAKYYQTDTNKEALSQELGNITIHSVDFDTKSSSSTDTLNANLCSILDDNVSNCFVPTSYNSATYHRLSSDVMEPDRHIDYSFCGIIIDKKCAHTSGEGN